MIHTQIQDNHEIHLDVLPFDEILVALIHKLRLGMEATVDGGSDFAGSYVINAGKTMSFLPPMTGNGKFIPPIKMVMTGGWFMALFYPHY